MGVQVTRFLPFTEITGLLVAKNLLTEQRRQGRKGPAGMGQARRACKHVLSPRATNHPCSDHPGCC